jgi:hypothetical protein
MELDNKVINKNEILSLLIKNQLNNVDLEKKLLLPDLKRIVNNLPFDIFNDECCIWSGYITNLNKDNKNCYISFFHKNKKIALHRLLFSNFVDELNDNEYLKFTCHNKGKCCSLKHLKKFIIEKAPIIEEKKEDNTVKNIGHNNKVFF